MGAVPVGVAVSVIHIQTTGDVNKRNKPPRVLPLFFVLVNSRVREGIERRVSRISEMLPG